MRAFIETAYAKTGINTAKNAIKVLLTLVSLASCAMGIYILKIGRTLWNDEAMLAWSVLSRDFGNMTATKLDYNQTAPVLYLYSVKLLTILFGNSEAVLRLFSYISFVGVLVLLFFILKVLFKPEDYAPHITIKKPQ
jgi:hypothetical protein